MSNKIQHLVDLKNRLENKRGKAIKAVEAASQRLVEIEHDLVAISRSLELLGGNEASSFYTNVKPDDLSKKSVIQCCVLIAKKNGNLLKMSLARHLMVEAGVLRSASASSILFTTMSRSKLFQHGKRRGEHEYVGEIEKGQLQRRPLRL